MTQTKRALDRLDERYRKPLLQFFFRKVRDRQEAEDLTQDVFVRVLRHPEAAQLGSADAFIFTVATNLLRDRARRIATHGHRTSLDDPQANRSLLGQLDAVEAGEGIDAERVLIGKEILSDLLAVLGGLSATTRDIFLLFRLEGMKQREIAEIYGISVSAVEKHIAKALKLIVERLGPK